MQRRSPMTPRVEPYDGSGGPRRRRTKDSGLQDSRWARMGQSCTWAGGTVSATNEGSAVVLALDATTGARRGVETYDGPLGGRSWADDAAVTRDGREVIATGASQ